MMRIQNRVAPLRWGLIIGACIFAPYALAVKVINVDSTADEVDDDLGDSICHTASSHCTLRAAVMQAVNNNASVTDRIKIMLPAGTYTFTLPLAQGGGQLDFALPAVGNPYIEVDGAGGKTTIIDANHLDRVAHISNRVVLLNDLTITNGNASDTDDGGGGIFNEGALYLNDVVVAHNATAGPGGGIHSLGNLSINGVWITLNRSEKNGGGIFNDLYDGITPNGLNMYASTISSNSALVGGGIANWATMTIANSTIAENGADYVGGGISSSEYSSDFNTNIYNSTIAYNDADQTRTFGGVGGGIYVDDSAGGTFNLYNSILTLNIVSNTPITDDCYGAINSHANNRFGSIDNCPITLISGSFDYLVPNALGDLQDNGGLTPTIALPYGSNAINAGSPTFGCRDINSDQFLADQRGLPRDVGICDLGAYEFGATDPKERIFKDGFEVIPPPVH